MILELCSLGVASQLKKLAVLLSGLELSGLSSTSYFFTVSGYWRSAYCFFNFYARVENPGVYKLVYYFLPLRVDDTVFIRSRSTCAKNSSGIRPLLTRMRGLICLLAARLLQCMMPCWMWSLVLKVLPLLHGVLQPLSRE